MNLSRNPILNASITTIVLFVPFSIFLKVLANKISNLNC